MVEGAGGVGEVVLVIPPVLREKVVEQRIGVAVDLWQIEIGSAVLALLPQSLRSVCASVSIESSPDRCVNLAHKSRGVSCVLIQDLYSSISTGVTESGSPEIAVSLEVEFVDADGRTVLTREFSASGVQSGPDQLQSWHDSYQFNSYGSGVDRALGNALTEAVAQVSSAIVAALENLNSRRPAQPGALSHR